jgi:hypothetical protein
LDSNTPVIGCSIIRFSVAAVSFAEETRFGVLAVVLSVFFVLGKNEASRI